MQDFIPEDENSNRSLFPPFKRKNILFLLSTNCNDNSQVCVISLEQQFKIHNSSQLLPLQTEAVLQKELRTIWGLCMHNGGFGMYMSL